MPESLSREERERIKKGIRDELRPYMERQIVQLEMSFLAQGRAVTRLEMLQYWRMTQIARTRAHPDYQRANAYERERIEARLEGTLEVIDELLAKATN